ncbi:MAG TPA: 2'-5' RNA ligase family protein [Gemmatimonadaceae bacterium]
MQPGGIFIIAELDGNAARIIREINERYDAKLARYKPPHITITGSSGVGPIPASVSTRELRERLEPITATTEPIEITFGAPMRFMQSDIVVLPLDPHGPLRILHDRIATSGLPFQQARFTFSPHCTLSLYPTLTRDTERELLSIRVAEPALIDMLAVYHTVDPQPARKLLTLRLGQQNP